MNQENFEFLAGLILGLFLGLFIVAMVWIIAEPYKIGQVDALTGKIGYELVVHDDSTRTWEEIK